MLRVRLLGGFEARDGDVVLPLADSPRAQSFLAYLLTHQETSQSRRHLAFLLWPDSTESQARTNLRHVLHNVRRALPDVERFVEISTHTLRWKSDAPYWLDIAAFDRSVDDAERTRGLDAEIPLLREAAALYSKDLLDGFYDEWLAAPRDRLRQRYLTALERLAHVLEGRGEYAEAVAVAQRLLREDPQSEGPYRTLMRLHAATGDRARAVRAYHACVSTLERDMGVAPSPATLAAYEDLMAGARASSSPVRPERVTVSALVGRSEQSAALTAAWRDADRGRAHLVLVSGEPGVGKTCVVDDFAARCAHQGALVANARSYAAEGSLAYGLLIAWLKTEGLRSGFDRLPGADRSDLSRLVPDLAADRPVPSARTSLAPTELHRRLCDVAARAMLATSRPILLVVDDIQWADAESLQFLHYLLRQAPTARLLVAATARREALADQPALDRLKAGLLGMDRYSEIVLERFDQKDTAVLAAQLIGRRLDAASLAELYAETEGNALFVTETLRAGWGRRADNGPSKGLAPKLQAVIRFRLSQLSAAARDLAGVAATIGREFPSDVLAGASDGDAEALVDSLDELWRRGIIRERGADAYDFTHDKIREVAYADLGPARRRDLHVRIADTLLRRNAPAKPEPAGQLAFHFERAGRFDDAIGWYVRASEGAQRMHAMPDALRLLTRALDLLARLPETAERVESAVGILSAIPALIAAIEGFTSPRIVDAQERAIVRSRALGIEPAPALLRSLAMTSLSRGDFESARRTGLELVARGERAADDGIVVEGHYLLGITAFWSAAFEPARDHFELAVRRYGSVDAAGHLLRFGHDAQVVCLGRLANTLCFLGQREAARRTCDQALARARTIDHPFTKGTGLIFAALLFLDLGDLHSLRAIARELSRLRDEVQSAPIRLSTAALLGFVDVLDGRRAAGTARIEHALRDVSAMDAAPGMAACFMRLLLASAANGTDAAATLDIADRAIALYSGVRTWEAEARRVRAEALQALGRPDLLAER